MVNRIDGISTIKVFLCAYHFDNLKVSMKSYIFFLVDGRQNSIYKATWNNYFLAGSESVLVVGYSHCLKLYPKYERLFTSSLIHFPAPDRIY